MTPTGPTPPTSSPSIRRRALRWGVYAGGGLLGLGLATNSFDGLKAPFTHLLTAALLCFLTFVELTDGPEALPAWLQFKLYAGAALAGVIFVWVAGQIENSTIGLLLFVATAVGFKALAAHMVWIHFPGTRTGAGPANGTGP